MFFELFAYLLFLLHKFCSLRIIICYVCRWWRGQRRYSSVDYRHRRRWRTSKTTSNSSARWVVININTLNRVKKREFIVRLQAFDTDSLSRGIASERFVIAAEIIPRAFPRHGSGGQQWRSLSRDRRIIIFGEPGTVDTIQRVPLISCACGPLIRSEREIWQGQF